MRRLAPVLALVTVLGTALAACGSSGPSGSSGSSPAASPAPHAGSACPDESKDAGRQVSFADAKDGTVLRGILMNPDGKGPGVVLGHHNTGSVCEWLPFGKTLAGKGYRVLAFDFAGEGDSQPHTGTGTVDLDMLTAARWLRTQGVTDLVLMGASKGGTAALAAAQELDPRPKAVVTLSAPATFRGVDALGAARKVTFPVLYCAGALDSPYGEQAQELYDATPAAVDRRVVVGPTATEHGTYLLTGSDQDRFTKAIDDFLSKNAPPAA
ncbi:alpha/beta hydrolase family protein [Dactylosporangium sp. NPDC048998]|uniref:alpha/beta hydrolase family protein n=1 Tax=Dactylosporangium sp. NPDC048998 TaxID=3363976 RepID=UPI00372351BC